MSTMTLDIETFKNLAHTLAGRDYTGNGQRYQHVGHQMVNHGNEHGFGSYNPNNKEYEGLARFMGGLYLLNHRAYNKRYAANHGWEGHYAYKFYNPAPVRLDIYQVLKSLQAIRYNIDTECVLLDQLINLVKNALIDNLPEYNNAKWG